MNHDARWRRVIIQPQINQEDCAFSADIPLSIVYGDDGILVLNKPAGLVVHPAANEVVGHFVEWLAVSSPAI